MSPEEITARINAPSDARNSPGYYEDAAEEAVKAERFADAATLYRRASAVSLGHNRAQRYENSADYFEEKSKG